MATTIANVVFGVRNDKYRGLLVESLKAPSSNVFFFKYEDQPLTRHCEQMQTIVRSANVKRCKQIHVDISPFLHEYFNLSDDTFMFRANKMNSVNQQIQKVQNMRTNKEIGILKRKITIADSKKAKEEEKHKKVLEKWRKDEENFQIERAKRIAELMARMEDTQSPSDESMDTK